MHNIIQYRTYVSHDHHIKQDCKTKCEWKEQQESPFTHRVDSKDSGQPTTKDNQRYRHSLKLKMLRGAIAPDSPNQSHGNQKRCAEPR
ncbi:MAG: hypothetical protein ACK51V_02130 [bacterium]